jgi:hypothetical protein
VTPIAPFLKPSWTLQGPKSRLRRPAQTEAYPGSTAMHRPACITGIHARWKQSATANQKTAFPAHPKQVRSGIGTAHTAKRNSDGILPVRHHERQRDRQRCSGRQGKGARPNIDAKRRSHRLAARGDLVFRIPARRLHCRQRPAKSHLGLTRLAALSTTPNDGASIESMKRVRRVPTPHRALSPDA